MAIAGLAVVATACVAGPGDGGKRANPDAASGHDPASREVHVDGRDVILVAGGIELVVATLDEEDGEILHASLRPGDHDPATVLALTRVEDAEAGPRYELRYLVATEDGVTDLFWFPARLQVDPEVAEVLDVAPLPVWAPDGSAVAWIEWAGDGTRLRTVGWRDEGTHTNPSDETSAYDLDEVPPGTQLEAWRRDDDGNVLVGRSEDDRWNIRLQAAHDPVVDVGGSELGPQPPG